MLCCGSLCMLSMEERDEVAPTRCAVLRVTLHAEHGGKGLAQQGWATVRLHVQMRCAEA